MVDRCDRQLAVGPHPDGFVEEWELEYLADERTLLLGTACQPLPGAAARQPRSVMTLVTQRLVKLF